MCKGECVFTCTLTSYAAQFALVTDLLYYSFNSVIYIIKHFQGNGEESLIFIVFLILLCVSTS